MTGGNRPADADGLLERLSTDGIERLWVVYHDYLGRAQGKIIPASSFASVVRGGVVFAKANLDFDHHDHQVAGARYLADSGDFLAMPDPGSYTRLPQFPDTGRVNAFMRSDDGTIWDGCPRTGLGEVLDEARTEGFSIVAALEPEFYVIEKSHGGTFRPTNETAMFSTAGLAAEEPFVRRVLDLLEGMDVRVPQIGKEYSPGQYELSTYHGDPLTAVDNYYAVREAVRDAAAEVGYDATFMPKPYANWSGNSLHVHISIWDAAGDADLTPDPADQASISVTGKQFIGGLLDHIEALTGLGSPTVNSYKRLLPGSWAPAHTYWGYGNRSGVIRIPGHGNRRHIEYRASDNSAQPEMLLTGLIAAGLDGIRRDLDPGEPFHQDIGHLSPDELAAANVGELPRALETALDALEADTVVATALGNSMLSHFLRIRRHEAAQYDHIVHAWERETYGPIS